MESALTLLGRRAFSVKEIAGKLKDKKYPGKEIATTIDRLEEMGYLNDGKFSIDWVKYRLGSGWGRKKIEQELSQKGIAEEWVIAAFAEWEENQQQSLEEFSQQMARTLLQRKFRRWQEKINSELELIEEKQKYRQNFLKEKNRRFSFLLRRGFSTQEALTAVEDSFKEDL